VPSRASKCADGGAVGTESSPPAQLEYELRDVVEPALAKALVLAAKAQRWELVAQIATELTTGVGREICGHHDRRETAPIGSLPCVCPASS
jgi:hypothetical protein